MKPSSGRVIPTVSLQPDLERWVRAVWLKCEPLQTCISLNQIYSEYEQCVDSAERRFADWDNDADLSETNVIKLRGVNLEENPLFAVETEQGAEGRYDEEVARQGLHALHDSRFARDSDDPFGLEGVDIKGGYIFFFSPTFVEDGGRWRIVVNARPYSKLVKIVRLIIPEIVNAGGAFKNVNSAKVMTPACFLSGRNDTLIIYARDRITVDHIITKFKMWIHEGIISTNDFVDIMPKTVHLACKGVGFATDPPNIQILKSYPAKPSYGRYLSQIISVAIRIHLALLGQKGMRAPSVDVLATVCAVFRRAGIDPRTPYEIGQMHSVFRADLPWADEASETDIRMRSKLYNAILVDLGWW